MPVTKLAEIGPDHYPSMPSPDRAPLRQRVFSAGTWFLAGYGLSRRSGLEAIS